MKYPIFFAPIICTFLLMACSNDHPGHQDEYTDAMAHEHHNETPVANQASDYEPRTGVSVQEEVIYGSAAGEELKGYLAEPAEIEGELPGVVLIHEWWGLNDNIRMMTRRLAGEGYRVLAVDLYDGEVADNSDRAQALMRAAMANTDVGRLNLSEAAAFLSDSGVSKIGVMGWCFGGAWTLNAAVSLSEKYDAGVIYYGRVNREEDELAQIEIPLLGIFGEDDGGIPVEQVNAFERTLAQLGKELEIHIYEDADHAFANPSGNRYNAAAAADAWDKTLHFLSRHLK